MATVTVSGVRKMKQRHVEGAKRGFRFTNSKPENEGGGGRVAGVSRQLPIAEIVASSRTGNERARSLRRRRRVIVSESPVDKSPRRRPFLVAKSLASAFQESSADTFTRKEKEKKEGRDWRKQRECTCCNRFAAGLQSSARFANEVWGRGIKMTAEGGKNKFPPIPSPYQSLLPIKEGNPHKKPTEKHDAQFIYLSSDHRRKWRCRTPKQ
jgi:hypothetical protein